MTSNKLESLRRGNSAKPFQSKLTPHLEFIRECRASRWPYDRIAEELMTRFGLRVAPSSIHAFVKARSVRRDVFTIVAESTPAPAQASTAPDDAIERLKAQATPRDATQAAWQFYDPSKPLEKLSHP